MQTCVGVLCNFLSKYTRHFIVQITILNYVRLHHISHSVFYIGNIIVSKTKYTKYIQQIFRYFFSLFWKKFLCTLSFQKFFALFKNIFRATMQDDGVAPKLL